MNAFKFLLVGACIAFASGFATGQDRVSTLRNKTLGEGWAGHEAATYNQHAQDGARMLYQYYSQPQPEVSQPQAVIAQEQPTVSPQRAKELVAGIRQDITASDKALAKIKAAHANEPAVLKQLASIETHHKRAQEVCGMAEEECLKHKVHTGMMSDCCSQMWHELDAAKKDTAQLFKILKIEKLEAPKKVATVHETLKQ